MSWNKKTHEQFIEEFKVKRPDLQVEGLYTTGKAHLTFICHLGHRWKTSPSHILNDMTPCPTCSHAAQGERRSKTQEEFIAGMIEAKSPMTLIGNYKNARTNVQVICPVGHIVMSHPGNLLKGSGCRQCVDYGKFRDSQITLYYVKILHEGRSYYKVGLTQREVSRRFAGKDGKKITCLYEEVYDSPLLAWEAEQSLLKAFKGFITKDKVLSNGGNTEVFCCDVLHMDNTTEDNTWL